MRSESGSHYSEAMSSVVFCIHPRLLQCCLNCLSLVRNEPSLKTNSGQNPHSAGGPQHHKIPIRCFPRPLRFQSAENCWHDKQPGRGRGLWHAFDSSQDILEDGHGSQDERVTFGPGDREETNCRQVALDRLLSRAFFLLSSVGHEQAMVGGDKTG